MLKRYIEAFALAGILIGTISSGAQAAPAYDAAGWRADYVQLKTLLEKNYANLAWAASPESGIDLPRLDRRTRAELASAQTDKEARQAIEDFVSAFNGGHLQIKSPLESVVSATPVNVARRAFDANDPAGTCASLGFVPGDHQINFSLPFESLPGFQLSSDGLTSVYRSGLYTTSTGTKIGIIRIPHFSMRAMPTVCTLAWAQLVSEKKPLTNGSVRDAAYLLWFKAFGDTINALRKDGATTLVVDVGNNSGGDDSGDVFPRLLTDKPVRSPALLVVASSVGADYLNEQISGIDDELKNHPDAQAEAALKQARDYFVAAKVKTTKPCDMSWVWREQRSWKGGGCTRLVAAGYAGGYDASLPRGAFGGNQDISAQLSWPSSADDVWAMWTGPLYVITDGQTYSSAEMFAADIQDNHLGKTVGATTGGDGCGFMGDEELQTLNHSHLRLRIPNCVRLRADGSNEVTGIMPNLPVLPRNDEDARQRAARMLDLIAADINGIDAPIPDIAKSNR